MGWGLRLWVYREISGKAFPRHGHRTPSLCDLAASPPGNNLGFSWHRNQSPYTDWMPWMPPACAEPVGRAPLSLHTVTYGLEGHTVMSGSFYNTSPQPSASRPSPSPPTHAMEKTSAPPPSTTTWTSTACLYLLPTCTAKGGLFA